MKKDFIPKGDADLDTWEENFTVKLPTYATELELTPAQVANITGKINTHRTQYSDAQAAKATSKAKVLTARNGRKTVEEEIREAAVGIKTKGNYTPEIGTDLRIIGPDETVDWATAKPKLKVSLDGGRIKVDWNKWHADGIIVFCKRGTESFFVIIGNDMEPPYFDDRPNLVAGVPEVREYYAYYIVSDEQRGVQSDVVSIKV